MVYRLIPALRIARFNTQGQQQFCDGDALGCEGGVSCVDRDVEYWRHDAIHVCVEVPE